MEYISTKEVSEKMGDLPRHIQVLCFEDRIPGAGWGGSVWIIFASTEKPKDERVNVYKGEICCKLGVL